MAKRRIVSLATMAVLVAMLAGTARADRLFLKNGQVLEGQVSETGDSVGIVTSAGVKMFPRGEVERIERDLLNSVPVDVRMEFVGTRHEAMDKETIPEAFEVWRRYLAEHGDGPLAGLAGEEIASLEKAAADGQVLWAGKLVTAAERDRARHDAHEAIDAAVAACYAGKYADARQKLILADSLWPGQTTVDFYMGVALKELRQPAVAAKRYYRVTATLPEHVPSLNNTACLCTQLTDYRSAVRLFAEAIERDPTNETLLNNAAEAMHGLEEDKQGPVLRLDFFRIDKAGRDTVSKALEDQQARHAKTDGTMRWGSQWISRRQYDDYLAARKAVDDRIAELQREGRPLAAELGELKSRVAVLEQMKDVALRSQNVQGALVLQRQIKQHAERMNELNAQLATLSAEAMRLRKSRPEPQWTGTLVMMDFERPIERFQGGAGGVDPTLVRAIQSGKAYLAAADGTKLGRLNADPYDPGSIWNPLGRFGSSWSKESMFDATSPWSDPSSAQSPFNASADSPPRIMVGEAVVGYLTENPSLSPRATVGAVVAILKSEKQ